MKKLRNNEAYSICVENVDAYISGMKRLKKYTFVWPDFEHVNGVGSKVTLYEHLDIIARTITNTSRLPWMVPEPGSTLKSGVMKRSHSDSGVHVVMSNSSNYNWDYFNNSTEVPGCRWILQLYCHTLFTYGEWRVFIVGGSIFHVVHTIYNKAKRTWSGKEVNSWYTLDELR
jgi:hypothetical protein